MHRLIQQKIVDHFREGEEVWFNRSDTLRSRAVLYDPEEADLLEPASQYDVIVKTKKGLKCGRLIDKDGLHFCPDRGRQFRLQWNQVYGVILETRERNGANE